MVHLLAVDGNSMAHRAWHAIRESDDATGAFVFGGVVALVAGIWHHGPYDAVWIAFDDEVNARKQWHPTYKADRHTDPELRERLRTLPGHLEDAGIATAVENGIEADDLLAMATTDATARGWRTDVLSGDRDLLPLVDDHVRLLRPRTTMGDLRVYDPGRVRAEYGVEPRAYRHLAALRGDPSDGLPGVDGIGEKTAARLLADHATLDELYANLCYLPAKVERALRTGRTLAMANLEVMRPLPVAVDLDRAGPLDVDRVSAVLDDHDQHRVARRLAHHVTVAALGPVPPPDEAPTPDDPFDRPAPSDDLLPEPELIDPDGGVDVGGDDQHEDELAGRTLPDPIPVPVHGDQPALFPVADS